MLMVVIGVLSLILAFQRPPWSHLRDAETVIAAATFATMLPALTAWLFSRRAIRLLEQHPADPGFGQYAYARGMLITQWLLGILHAGLIVTTDWLGLCRSAPFIADWPLVPGLLAGVPLLISILLTWIAVYPADRAIREIALEVYLFRGKPTQPVWPLSQFLVFNFRHQVLIILLPMLLILIARDVVYWQRAALRAALGHEFAPDLLLGVLACGVALIAPLILRHVWITIPLPDGPLRDQLLQLCKKLRMRCRNILVWKSGGMITNAAVMGVVAPLRYVLITDAMLEQMDDRKIEAVFGHEAGHIKRHHILFFLLFAFVSGCLITVTGERLRGADRLTVQIVTAIVGGLFLFKWGVLFGWISRLFERQADLFGVHTLSLTGLRCDAPCAIHHPPAVEDAPEEPGAKGAPVCRTAAHLFGDTLNDVAVLNNIPPESWSWRHGSIASRSRILQKYALSPTATQKFESTVRWIKLGILSAAVISGGWAAWELHLWTMLLPHLAGS